MSEPTPRTSGRFFRPDPEDLNRILEITRQMAAERDFVKLLNLIMNRTTEIMRADRSSLFMIDREAGECWSKIAQGSEIAEIRFPIGVGIVGSVAETGVPANIPDAYEDPRFNPGFDKKTGYRTKSVLCIPLRDLDGEVVGVMQVLNKEDGEPFSGYDEYLLTTLGAQAGVTLMQAHLMESYLEGQKLQQEMSLARVIQRNLLPDQPPELPGFEIAAFCESADATGGDYYDFLEVVPRNGEPPRVGVAIGDVSGHGLGAALVMVQARSILRTLFEQGRGLPEILEIMNRHMARDLEDDRFMTFFLAMLEPGRMRFCNAGHEPPIHYRPGAPEGERFRELDSDGLLLGVLEEMEYPEGEPAELKPGDMLLLCTDGLFEARNPREELFGNDRMLNCIEELADKPAKEVVEGIVKRIYDFAEGEPMADDLTFVIVKAVNGS